MDTRAIDGRAPPTLDKVALPEPLSPVTQASGERVRMWRLGDGAAALRRANRLRCADAFTTPPIVAVLPLQVAWTVMGGKALLTVAARAGFTVWSSDATKMLHQYATTFSGISSEEGACHRAARCHPIV
jgi:hypothetical protein